MQALLNIKRYCNTDNVTCLNCKLEITALGSHGQYEKQILNQLEWGELQNTYVNIFNIIPHYKWKKTNVV